MNGFGDPFGMADVDALLACRRIPVRLPAGAPPPTDGMPGGGWRCSWTGAPLRLAARALRDGPPELFHALEGLDGHAAIVDESHRLARLVRGVLEKADRHASALAVLMGYAHGLWPHPSVQGLFVFLATCCARNDGTRSWWDEEVAEPVDNARMALRALVEEGAWRTDAEALAEVREMWLTAAEVLRDRVTGEYADQLRACKDLSFGDGDRRAEAVRAMADEWRPRMPQIGAWFRDVGAVARALP